MPVPASTCCLLAVLPEYPGPTETIAYQFTGLAVVFTALGGIWMLVELTGWFFRRRAARRPATAVLSPPPAIVAASSSSIHVVIAAAVHCIYRGRARIVSIEPTDHDPSWAREGRRAIFSSHKIH